MDDPQSCPVTQYVASLESLMRIAPTKEKKDISKVKGLLEALLSEASKEEEQASLTQIMAAKTPKASQACAVAVNARGALSLASLCGISGKPRRVLAKVFSADENLNQFRRKLLAARDPDDDVRGDDILAFANTREGQEVSSHDATFLMLPQMLPP